MSGGMSDVPMYEVEQFKVWKGIDPEKPCWASRNFVSPIKGDMDAIAAELEKVSGTPHRVAVRDQCYTFSGTGTPSPDFWSTVRKLATQIQQADDEDGGMHAVGVQMLVGYEEGQFTVDDLFRRVTT